MQNGTRKPLTIVIILLIISLVVGISYLMWSKKNRLPIVGIAPNWTLENVNGQRYSLQSLGKKVKLVEFIFLNCPDICPTTTMNMVKMQEELKKRNLFEKDVWFVGISFDPERDTPELIRKYADKMGIDWRGWSFYRDSEKEIQKVLQDYKIFADKQPDGYYVHPTKSLFLIDKNNNIRKIYYMGDQMNNEEILKDIIRLAKE